MTGQKELRRKVDYGLLLSFYGALLTARQREMLSLYCDEDYALSEVAQMMQVTRQCVNDTLNRAFDRLDDLEERLGLVRRMERLTEGMAQVDQLIMEALETPDSHSASLQQARKMIEKMRKQEEE